MSQYKKKIVLPGGAGLVGQNLIVRLLAQGYGDIVVLDKHRANLDILRKVHPKVTAEFADLSVEGDWRRHIEEADVVVMLQAQIGGNDRSAFERNNLDSTRRILDAMRGRDIHVVHISSSVVASVVHDYYSDTKREQERVMLDSGMRCITLRPTLMFGWFDRKHLGWLSRFMRKSPIFPIPGNGQFVRQPLYVGDFCSIIMSCIGRDMAGGVYDISGLTKMYYLDIIRDIRQVIGAHTAIVRIPYRVFQMLLWTWALVDRDPPFTTQQLAALIAPDEFKVIDWPAIFDVAPTPFAAAIAETFNDPRFGNIVLEF
ncbi:MAG TPA: NAD-dependent epimerase/dehydratase family protein [Steroidobacteraceae bacterium]|jgi:nucleoside-diphosphate-sugar epimerase